MKNTNYKSLRSISFLVILFCSISNSNAQEDYGNTLNLGVGIGYYSYAPSTMPVLHANYEFDVAPSFTLAPFISYYSYTNYYYWGNPNTPYRDWRYRETVIPIGLKGTYYFDDILGAGDAWDFYLGASLGVSLIRTSWEDGYLGDRRSYRSARGTTPLYLDGHIGAEYHLNDRAGLFLDLSSGMSTFGLAIH